MSLNRVDRKDHVWFKHKGLYKCCLCGAVCEVPPPYPTPANWMPMMYEPLNEPERMQCKRPSSRR